MISAFCAVTPALYFLSIVMAHVAGQEDLEKSTPLKDLLSRIDLDELMKKDEPPFIFPKTLEEFGYAFNEYGQLRHTKTGEPFVFNEREDLHRWNQKRYEALGEDERQCHMPIEKTKFLCKAGEFGTSTTAQKSLPFINLPPGTVSERAGSSLRELCEMAQGRDWKRIISAP